MEREPFNTEKDQDIKSVALENGDIELEKRDASHYNVLKQSERIHQGIGEKGPAESSRPMIQADIEHQSIDSIQKANIDVPQSNEQQNLNLSETMRQSIKAQINEVEFLNMPIQLVHNNDILSISAGFLHPKFFQFICSALLIIPALITLYQMISQIESYTPYAEPEDYQGYVDTFKEHTQFNNPFNLRCRAHTYQKNGFFHKGYSDYETKDDLMKKEKVMRKHIGSHHEIFQFQQLSINFILNNECNHDVYIENFNQCTGKTYKIKLSNKHLSEIMDSDPQQCLYYISETQALELVTNFKDFEINAHKYEIEHQYSYWRIVIDPYKDINGQQNKYLDNSLMIWITAPHHQQDYTYVGFSEMDPFRMVYKSVGCKTLINISPNQQKIDNDKFKDSIYLVKLIRNTQNIPNLSDLWNIFGLGNFFGATILDPPERVLFSTWQSTKQDQGDSMNDNMQDQCDIDNLYIQFNMHQQLNTELTYFGFPDVEAAMVSQVAIAMVIFQLIFNKAFLKRGIHNLSLSLAEAIEDKNSINRNHQNQHIKKRAENMDKLEEIHDMLRNQISKQVFKQIQLDDKKDYRREIGDQLKSEELESALEEIQQYGTNWHYYKTSHQIKLLEEVVLGLVSQSQYADIQAEAANEKILKLEKQSESTLIENSELKKKNKELLQTDQT